MHITLLNFLLLSDPYCYIGGTSVSIGAAAIMGALSHTKLTYTVGSRGGLYARVQLTLFHRTVLKCQCTAYNQALHLLKVHI